MTRGLVWAAMGVVALATGCQEDGAAVARQRLAVGGGQASASSSEKAAPASPESLPEADVIALLARSNAPQRVSGSSRFVWQSGERMAELEESLLIEKDDEGRLHALLNASNDDGFEYLRMHEGVFVRRRYANWHRFGDIGAHAPLGPDEVWRSAWRVMPLLGDALAFKPRGEVEVNGRKGKRFALALSGRGLPAAPAKAPPESWEHAKAPAGPDGGSLVVEPPTHWREGLSPVEVSGHVVLDAELGLPLAMEMSARLVDNRGEAPVVLIAEAKLQWATLSGDESPELGLPVDAGPPPTRPSEPLDYLDFWDKKRVIQPPAPPKKEDEKKEAQKDDEKAAGAPAASPKSP